MVAMPWLILQTVDTLLHKVRSATTTKRILRSTGRQVELDIPATQNEQSTPMPNAKLTANGWVVHRIIYELVSLIFHRVRWLIDYSFEYS